MKRKLLRQAMAYLMTVSMLAISLPEASLTALAEENDPEYLLDAGSGGVLTEDIVIDGENFPDENFREYVSEHFDEDKDGRLSGNEAESVSSIDVSEQNILTLKGIEFFSGLTYLVCSGNNLSSLDVSKNTVLTDLDCSDNLYTIPSGDTLDLSDLPDFDVSRADNWENGTVEGTVLTATGATVQYTYDCGNGFAGDFMIVFQENIIQENGDDPAEIKEDDLPEDDFSEENFQEEDFTDENLCEYVPGESDEDDRLSGDVAEETESVYFLGSDLTGDVEINKDNFPDEKFREYVSEHFDEDEDGWLSEEEIGSVSSINVKNKNISTLQGIEFFGNLTELDCCDNNLNSLDVSHNTALVKLYCENNTLSSLDVSKNPALESLNCSNNNLSSLDVSHQDEIHSFSCSNNIYTISSGNILDLSTLPGFDVSRAGNWENGTVDGTILTATGAIVKYTYNCDNGRTGHFIGHFIITKNIIQINEDNFPDKNFRGYISEEFDENKDGWLSGVEVGSVRSIWVRNKNISTLEGLEIFYNLTKLNCAINNLSSLDVSKNLALEELDCQNNNLSELDVSGHIVLKHLDCRDNNLSSLKVSGDTALEWLDCSNNKLSNLYVSENTVLSYLQCQNNNLRSLDISHNPALYRLNCENNNISSLDASRNSALKNIFCYNNNLNSLKVSRGSVLEQLYCWSNKLSSLDVSDNPALRELYCYDNNLSSLNVRGDTALKYLLCEKNKLSSLDVSENPALEQLYCDDNNLSSLDVSHTALTSGYYFHCSSNVYTIPSGNTFDLSTLPGFDVSKASNWKNGTVKGTILTLTGGRVSYTYDCGRGFSKTFYLEPAQHTAHTYKDKVTPATLSKDGTVQSTCSVCGAAKKATVISRPATIKLSAESYVYDGKVKKPTVTVKDKSGKTIPASNYTVTYASGRKNVGSYTVKVTFKGNYSGSKTLSFAINPAPAKSLSVSPGSGKLTVKWKKNATQISGYEIMYSTSSSFAKAGTKTVTVKSSAAQKEIKKLKPKTTYYVRVRTYKTVGKQKYYSAWSKKVKVTTKK